MIAIYDSGFGGLTVLKPIIDLLPEYDYLYFGDNARAPYGIHSPEIIKKFSEEVVDYLFDRGATLIIFACNTTSSTSLRYIQEKYLKGKDEKERKILGVTIPMLEKAAETTKRKRIGLVGTKATIASKAYEYELKKLDPEIELFSKACPLLVPLIEEDWHKKPEAKSILKKYLRSIKTHNIDTLILGCTHYPLMAKEFRKIMGKKVNVLEGGEIVAEKLKEYLERHKEIESKLTRGGGVLYETTDDPEKMQTFIEKNFGMKIKMPKKVTIKT